MNISQLFMSYHNRSGDQDGMANVVAANSIMRVIRSQLLEYGTVLTLTLCCHDRHTCNFYNNMLEKLFHVWGLTVVQLVMIHTNFTLRTYDFKLINLIFVDSFKSFREIDIASNTKNNNYNEYYYIFIQVRDYYLPRELQQILDYCWANSIINCSVQSQNAHGEIFVYSYYPFTADFCGFVKPVVISHFNGTDFIPPTLFPRKLTNFHGCVLRAALWHIPPFLALDTDTQGVSRIVGGIEGNLLRLLAQQLNFTIDVKVPAKASLNNTRQAIGFDMIQRGEVEFILGYFPQSPAVLDIVSNVASYYQTRQIMCVARSAYQLTSLEFLVTPFDGYIWLSLWCAFIANWILYYATCKYWKESHEQIQPILSFLAILLGMPATHIPDRSYARLLVTTWLFFTLLVRTVYSGIFFTLLHHEIIAPPPNTFKQLFDQNYTAVMTATNQAYLADVKALQKLPSIILPSLDVMSVFDYILKNPRRNLLAVGLQDFLNLYRKKHKDSGDFFVLRQDLLNLPLTMYLAKHSYLIDQFEEEIWWIRSAGFVHIWTFQELQFKAEVNGFDEVLLLDNLSAFFATLGFGLCVSLVVFTLEIFSLRIPLLRRWLLKVH